MTIFPRFSAHWKKAAFDDAPEPPITPRNGGAPDWEATTGRTRKEQNRIESALDDAERKGFLFALLSLSCAILMIGLLNLVNLPSPTNMYAFGGAAGTALIGVLSLLAVKTRYESKLRFALFAFDTMVITALIAFVPLSSSSDVPQNLVFLTPKVQYFYILIATAILTLSPALVIWTGAWAVAGLVAATGWIVLGMDTIVTFRDMAPLPWREVFLDAVLNPNFIGLSLRGREAIILASVTAIAAWGVHRARGMVRAHAQADAERQKVETLFGRYVPPTVLTELIREGHLEPQMREATLLFIDIEGFTRIAETMPPAKLVVLLNDLFSTVAGVVERNGGVVINYIGDAILASFNAPLPAAQPAAQVIQTARRVLELVSRRRFEGLSIHLRIGIATGPVAAGTVGSDGRQTYTLYGDAVNLAQRLERLNKDFGTQCLVCGTTARLACASNYRLKSVGLVHIRNRVHPIEVFRLH
ncbi:adenylate/guanylate cyclase domain-containing protein [Pararhizobium sp. PWRC1-1]|uniref:adenylate/guanylate cyclase domain-containing protein n=1 Tax=Pararhizobium sp. PWRC1-1 TaxID=2804566 RepID=UPI003CE9E0D9